MTSSLTVAAYCFGSTIAIGGFAGLVEGMTADGFSWNDVASGGAAVLVIVVVMIFLRSSDSVRKEHIEGTRAIVSEFAATVKAQSADARIAAEKFGETTTNVLRDSREREAANVSAVADLLRDIHLRGGGGGQPR